ncbi:TerD family protein [Streptomyces sp. NPDC005805]|uniref:TerD family protein n=1 Tax=Streptomyces sp. NPDC005805 TaxID=3157068 RepID=UPI0034000BF7
MSSLSKGVRKAEVALKWDPSPLGEAAHDLDLVAAAYEQGASDPAYVVHFDSRSPDGTIILARQSGTGQGFGADEVLTVECDRLADRYDRVIVGVVAQQRHGRLVFGDVANTGVKVTEGYTELASYDLGEVAESTAAVLCSFGRDETGAWVFHGGLRGFDTDLEAFTGLMGR